MTVEDSARAAFERRIGYTFSNRSLLAQALSHSSAKDTKGTDNERLEFLGDRVLGLVVAEMLYDRFSAITEGELARRFNGLVRMESCADVAREIDVGSVLILGEGEAEAGGRHKERILANACEAVLGAAFLDGGFETARRLVNRFWGPRLEMAADDPIDPKTALQEWAQGLGLALPSYVEVAREGPAHKPHFTSEVQVTGKDPARGEGSSKRAAERSAAENLLLREGIWTQARDRAD